MSALLLENRIFLHYEVLGRGAPPVLFLHTWVGSWRYWLGTMQEVSLRNRAYALDFYGYGSSLGQAPPSASLDAFVDQVRSFMEALGVVDVVLVGHGLGAAVALALATQEPEWVQRVMTIGLPLSMDWARGLPRRAAEFWPWLTTDRKAVLPVQQDSERITETTLDAALRATAESDLLRLAREVEQPWLAIYGQEDPVYQDVLRLGNRRWPLPTSPYHHVLAIPQAAHFPMLEQPRLFYRLLKEFLTLPPWEDLRNLQLRDEWRRRFR
ncbi:MAG: alpha/beta hydrolase [Chloroflexi bacterium]|nr:alpha/beta hydrolase [Chloroflexota bacterium]